MKVCLRSTGSSDGSRNSPSSSSRTGIPILIQFSSVLRNCPSVSLIIFRPFFCSLLRIHLSEGGEGDTKRSVMNTFYINQTIYDIILTRYTEKFTETYLGKSGKWYTLLNIATNDSLITGNYCQLECKAISHYTSLKQQLRS